MEVDEHAREELHRGLETVLGDERAETLMTLLRPVEWIDVATHGDFRTLSQRIDTVETQLSQRIDTVEIRLSERIEWRCSALEQRIETSEQRILAAFRGELNAAVTSQTRTMILAMSGAVLSMGAMALAIARLS